jgi:hypothetical protein
METATATKAAKLVAASERMTLDPFVDVDWSVEVNVDDVLHLPVSKLPLYGTAVWDRMTETERNAYSRHECAALCAAGIWFENLLMQAILRHLTELPVTDPAHRYLLVEVADECRHSTMFGEYIRRAGTPAYAPSNDGDLIGAAETLPGGRAMAYLLVLAVEEMLDVANRATMKDESVHSVSRQMAKLHVLEEARHVSFAKTYLTEVWPQIPVEERNEAAAFAPAAVAFVSSLIVNDEVYATLGIEGGGDVARANPLHQQRVIADLGKLTAFLTELGVIDDTTRPLWQEAGLMAFEAQSVAA